MAKPGAMVSKKSPDVGKSIQSSGRRYTKTNGQKLDIKDAEMIGGLFILYLILKF